MNRHIGNGLIYLAAAALIALTVFSISAVLRGGFRPAEHHGEMAKSYYLERFENLHEREAASAVLGPASRCYVFDGSTFAGSRWCWTCTLESEESCFQLLRLTPLRVNLRNPPLDFKDMIPYEKNKLMQGVVGPLQFGDESAAIYWYAHLIDRGCYFLEAEGDRYYLFIIDLDRLRVYECYQS